MSVSIMALVFAANMPELKTDDGRTVPDTTAKFVLLAMADNASEDGENCYSGIRKLCQKTNFSTATVCNALNALRHNGFLELVGKSKADTNNYTVKIEKLQSLRFQPLKQPDSSGYNPSVLATETKPSINHQIKPKKETPNFKELKPADYRKIPELKTFIDATGWIPGSFVIETVYNFVRAGLTAEKIEAAFSAWTARGYKPANVEGYLTWARDGIPQAYGGKTEDTGAKPAINTAAVEATKQLIEQKFSGNFVPRPASVQRPQIGKES